VSDRSLRAGYEAALEKAMTDRPSLSRVWFGTKHDRHTMAGIMAVAATAEHHRLLAAEAELDRVRTALRALCTGAEWRAGGATLVSTSAVRAILAGDQ